MNKKMFFSTIAIAAILVFGVVSCKKDVTGVTLDQTTATLAVGKTLTLTATVSPEKAANKNVKWLSDNENVAIVNNGIVNAISEGKATITVITEDGGKTASCLVTVIPPPIDTVTEKTMTVVVGIVDDRYIKFEFAGTGTMTITRGKIIDTFLLSATPLSCEYDKSGYKIIITGKNISYMKVSSYWAERIDVSENINLKKLDCSGCRNLWLGGLYSGEDFNVSKNTELTELYCTECELRSLDVSKNTKLTHLVCRDNRLTSLDVSKNTKLKILDCGDYHQTLDIIPLLESLHNNSIEGKTVYYSSPIPIGEEPFTEPHWKIAKNKGWKIVDGEYTY